MAKLIATLTGLIPRLQGLHLSNTVTVRYEPSGQKNSYDTLPTCLNEVSRISYLKIP